MATAEKSGQLKKLKTGIKISNLLRKVGIDIRKKLFGKSVLSNFGGELQMIICGGAALNQSIIDFFEAIGVVILNGYGITECAPLISCNRNEYRRAGSVGLPIIGGEVKIHEPNEAGEGEIYLDKDVFKLSGTLHGESIEFEVKTDKIGAFPITPGDHFDIYHQGRLIYVYPKPDMKATVKWVCFLDSLMKSRKCKQCI
jgi:acyl-CoA synthetase (AMP-forming)/AMP-acid ligase II